MRSTRQTKSKQESRPNELTVCELVDTLRNARPNQFVTVFHELPEPVLLQLLHKLTTLDESSLLKLFAIQYTLPINYYDGLRKLIIDYYSHSDAVLLALFDLIDALNSSYYTRALFLDFGGKYPHNVLTQITRSRSATVIKKALSVVLRLNHVHRDDVLRTPLVDYRLEQTVATQVTGSLGNSYHIYYQATPIIAAFERTKEPHIALALVQTLNNRLDSRECLIREDILQKALAYNNELVVCYLLEQPHFHVDPSKIDPIKTRDPHVSDRINALLKSTPFYRALHKNTITTLPDHIKNDTRQTPLILKSRWSEDNTLLHLAAVMNHLDALKFLLSQSLDLDAVNANGLTALHLALNKDCKESISLLIEHGKASLHLAGVDGIWPLQHIMRYNQYELAKTSLRILLRSLPHEAVFSSLSCALNDVAIRPCRTSHVNDVSLSMGKLHPDISLYEALSNSCKTANDATGALLQAVATLYNSAQNPVLNRAVDNFLHHQLHVLLDNPSSHHQNSSRLALIVFLFSQPTQYISGVLNRLSKSAHEQTQLELVLIQALTKPLIYTKLSYETQQKLMTFFAPTSGSLQHLIATHFQRSNLALLPAALLRDFSNHSTPRALYEALQQRVDPILMVLALEKCLRNNPVDLTMSENVQKSLEQELMRLSEEPIEKSMHELSYLLNLITHPSVKAWVNMRLTNTTLWSQLDTLFLNLSRDTPLDEHSLLRDIFLTIAKNPRSVLESNHDAALIAFVHHASPEDVACLIDTYQALLLDDQNAAFIQKLHSCIMHGLLDHPHLESVLESMFRWSIAYSPYTTDQDTLVSYMPYLLQAIPTNAWKCVGALLVHTNDSYIASLKLLKEGLVLTKNSPSSRIITALSFLNDEWTVRHDASLLFMTHLLPILEADLFSPESLLAVEAIVQLLYYKMYTDQFHLIDALPARLVTRLLEHALSGVASDDHPRADTCKTLLTCLSQAGAMVNEAHLSLIKTRLSQQDLALLNDTHLRGLAQMILGTKDNGLDDATYSGVWIQRLITSVQFVSASSPDVLHRLTERYRLISLNLKQAEFDQLNGWISGRLSHAGHHSQALERVRLDMMQDPARREHLLAKSQRLLQFRADDSIRALFNQLEDACVDTHTIEAENALNVLYAHYNLRLSSLRTDYLFKLSNVVFTRVRRGDIEMAQRALLQWFARYLPHQNFEQSELARKSNIHLYDSTGKQIGFITESNHAVAFLNDEPCPLIQVTGMTAGMTLYDQNRLRIGELTKTCEIKYDNIFQKSTSALMIARVPGTCLEQSKLALDLLIQDVLRHDELRTLYQCDELAQGSEQRTWVEHQLETRLSLTQHKVSLDTIDAVLAFHSNESIVTLLGCTRNTDNAQALFQAILKQDDKRTALFEHGRSSFAAFLTRSPDIQLFADFLTQYHSAPWFHHGLSLFAHAQSSNDKRASLLLNALAFVNQDIDIIIHTLLQTETNARIILHDFLSDEGGIAIQDARTSAIDAFTSCFSIAHITPILHVLNQKSQWLTSAHYRLVLMAFSAHHDTLFPARELRLSETQAWHAGDLIELTRMVKRHRLEGHSYDKELAIGNMLLSELTLRTANFGQTHLFYTENTRLDVAISQFNLSRSVLSTLIARTLPATLVEAITAVFGLFDITRWFERQHDRQQELTVFLEKEGALIDWEKMTKESWRLSSSTQLPLISAFLMHYSGDTKHVADLLNDYFTSPTITRNQANIHRVTQLLTVFPNRDMSRLIFDVIQTHLIATPSLLDDTILTHMAAFHARTLQHKLSPIEQELTVIKHFGQQKQYDMVFNACRILLQKTTPTRLQQKLIQQIQTEARVECELAPQVNRWYFSIWAFFKRGWNYWGKKPSSYVKFCDDPAPYEAACEIPGRIHTSVLGGDTITQQHTLHQYSKQAQQLKVRVDAMTSERDRLSGSHKQNTEDSSISNQGLFSSKEKVILNPMHDAPASNQNAM